MMPLNQSSWQCGLVLVAFALSWGGSGGKPAINLRDLLFRGYRNPKVIERNCIILTDSFRFAGLFFSHPTYI